MDWRIIRVSLRSLRVLFVVLFCQFGFAFFAAELNAVSEFADGSA
jgi:hypothetical protein